MSDNITQKAIDIDKRFAETVYLIEANSYEQMCLCKEWNERVNWKSDGGGPLVTLGHIGGFPVCVSFLWTKIDGHYVCFWDPTSAVVDYNMIDEWFRTNVSLPAGDQCQRNCDAMNSQQAIHYIQKLNKKV